ncbi:MAG: PQQ-binding-like beta-propeller repeat protein [Planctomycetota bacterium]|nr:PQQ-binding-like beta-propeller repeat protein [Planctomycetota bacterium]
MRYGLGLLLSVIPLQYASSETSQWLQFRGPAASSHQPQASPPIQFDAASGKNVSWRVDLPGRSAGGAIAVDGQVIATSSSGMDQRRIFITSVSAKTGETLWEQNLVARGRPFCHPYSANAAPTPASDGQLIFAFYSSNDLVALNLKGEVVWYRSLGSEFPKSGNDTGMSSSPLVIEDTLVVQVECQGESFAAGLDTKSGDLLWKIERPHQANWSSPVPWFREGSNNMVVLTSGVDVTVVNARSGAKLATLDKGASTISSALAVDDQLYIAADGMTAYQWNTTTNMLDKLWQSNKLEPGNSSPIVFGATVVALKGGVLTVADAQDGSIRYKTRLPDSGSIWSTPVVCKDNLYVFTDTGRCFVVAIGEKSAEIVATNELGEMVLGSPAVSDDSLLVRSNTKLWKIAKSE